MKKLFLILATLTFTSLAQADVTARTGSLTMKVNMSPDGLSANFQEVNLATGATRDLGARKYYTLAELRAQRSIEGWDVPQSIAADVGLVVATIVTDGAIFYAFYPVMEAGLPILIASGLIDVGTMVLWDPLNPHLQWQQYLCLREEVITDKSVSLETEEDVAEFIDAFEDALDNVEGKIKHGSKVGGSLTAR